MNTVDSRAVTLSQTSATAKPSSTPNVGLRPPALGQAASSRSETAKAGRTPEQSLSETTSKIDEQSAEELRKTVDEMNQAVQSLRRELQFSIDDRSGEMIIKVVNIETEEVVRQIPREEVLNLAQSLHASGKSLTQGTKA